MKCVGLGIPSTSDYHTHEDDEYESFLTWMVNIPYHDYREGEPYPEFTGNLNIFGMKLYVIISEGVQHWAIIFNIVILFIVFIGVLYEGFQKQKYF